MRFFLGLDLGQASDYTAIAVLERIEPESAPDERQRSGGWKRERPPAHYHGRHLERVALGTPYPRIAERVRSLLAVPQLRGKVRLIVDATGVGRPVVDMLRSSSPVPVTITGGDNVVPDGAGYRVPKRDLVGVVQVLLQTERLRISPALPLANTLTEELTAFRVKIDPLTAHDSYGSWREGSHDDLVLAVAVAAWYAEKRGVSTDPADYPALRS